MPTHTRRTRSQRRLRCPISAPQVAAQIRAVRDWNQTHPIGTPVIYWPGARYEKPRQGNTAAAAYLLEGHTAVVPIDAGRRLPVIALSHVEPLQICDRCRRPQCDRRPNNRLLPCV
jgi:hypothetical protein